MSDENVGESDTAKEIAEVRKKLLEKEADIREMRARLFLHYNVDPDAEDGREEIEPLSIFVGNVDYACTAEEVPQHFQACGDVNRVTILSDEFGQPKGFGYVEFADEEALEKALQLNDSELHGRKLKVMRKRRNLPGMKQYPPRRYNPYVVAYGHSSKFPKP